MVVVSFRWFVSVRASVTRTRCLVGLDLVASVADDGQVRRGGADLGGGADRRRDEQPDRDRHREHEQGRPTRRALTRSQQFRQALAVPRQERRVARGSLAQVGQAPAQPEPVLRLLEQAVGDAEDPRQRQAEPVGVRVPDRDLDREQRPLVLADAELGERELIVPAEQLPVGLAEHVADRRGVVGPGDDRQRWIEDDRHPEVEAAAAVEDEVPGGDPVAIGPLERLQAELGEPALDVGRAHERGPGVGGWHGPRSLAENPGSVRSADR